MLLFGQGFKSGAKMIFKPNLSSPPKEKSKHLLIANDAFSSYMMTAEDLKSYSPGAEAPGLSLAEGQETSISIVCAFKNMKLCLLFP